MVLRLGRPQGIASSSILFISAFFFLQCRDANDVDTRTVLDGTWRTACLASDSSFPSYAVQYVFGARHAVERRQDLYLDAACGTIAGSILHQGLFSLEVRPEVSLYNIDFTFTTVAGTPVSNEGRDVWNRLGYCGFRDWIPAVSRSLNGNPSDDCLAFGVNAIAYRDVVRVEGQVRSGGQTQIIFGQTLNHLVPRPDFPEPGKPDHVFRPLAP